MSPPICACGHSAPWHMPDGDICVYPVDGKNCGCRGVHPPGTAPFPADPGATP